MRRTTRAVAVLASITGSLSLLGLTPASAALTDPPTGPSGSGALSADGRYLAFVSEADNLLDGEAANDTNGVADAFVLDLQTGTIELASRLGATQANGATTEVDISADGRYVAFVTHATNLLGTDANGDLSDVFVLDRQTDALTLVSRRGATGAQGNSTSVNVSISNDGTKVAFASYASNLVGNDTNNAADAFVRDLAEPMTTRVSTNSNGRQANAATLYVGLAGGGAVVGFASAASNLVAKDTNGKRDVFVKVLQSGKTQRVSVTNAEKQANGSSTFYGLSDNGKIVAFSSDAPNLVSGDTNAKEDAFARDRTDATTVRVSRRGATQSNGPSYGVAVSGDGAYVTFTTTATNLGTDADGNGAAADLFEFDLATKALHHLSVDATGGWADAAAFDPAYGPNDTLVFSSYATDLVAGDVDGVADVFTRELGENRDVGTTT
ncbi:MAG TPA: hypothetical protein VF235_07980, partial [Actinomycetota bacterium]